MELLAEPLETYDAVALAAIEPATPANLPAVPGASYMRAGDEMITAQRVAVPRSPARIMAELKALAMARGEAYVYSWTVNDRRNRRQVTIEGPTVKLANDVARIYGNCLVKVRVDETPTHWIITPRFIDLETGYGYERPFQQRKSQDTGMKDADRQADLVFQIGVSKAIRNVIVNVLSTYVEYAVEESKSGLAKKFTNPENVEKANAFIDRVMEEYHIAELRVQAVVGRKRADWTVKDLVRVYAEMRGIHEKMTVPDEIYPSMDDARIVDQEKKEKAEAGKAPKAEKPKAEKKAAPATDEKPAASDAALGVQDGAKTATAATTAAPADGDMPDIPPQLRRTAAKPEPKTAEPPAAQDDTDGLFAGA